MGGVCRDLEEQQLAPDPPVITPLSEQKPPHVGFCPLYEQDKMSDPGRWETPTISHPAHGALQILPLSPLNHIQGILYFCILLLL